MRREAGILLGVVSLILTLGTDQEAYVPEKMEEKYELQNRESVKVRKKEKGNKQKLFTLTRVNI
jgi:hypothetical protein